MSKLGEKIISFLQNHSSDKFPDYGAIAGQSVAEAYFRIMNIPIYTRLKDIDLYIDIQSKVFPKKFADIYVSDTSLNLDMGITNKFLEVRRSTSSLTDSPIDYLGEYSEKYKIIRSYDHNNINIVHSEIHSFAKKDSFTFLKKTVENFDINSVKIGVCLKTKRVYVSEDFREFLISKQVKIVNYHRLASSIIRVATKMSYYKGAYFDLDYEVNLLYANYCNLKNKREKLYMTTTQDKISKLDKKTIKILSNYFNFNPYCYEMFNFIVLPYSSNKKDEYPSKKREIEKFIDSGIENGYNFNFIMPFVNYFNPDNLYTNFKELNYNELYEKALNYKNSNSDNKTTPIMRKFIFNTKRDILKNDIIILKSKELQLVQFIPRTRKKEYSYTLKNNIKQLLANKKGRYLFETLCSNRRNTELLFSNKKVKALIAQYKNGHEAKTKCTLILLENKNLINIDSIPNNIYSVLARHKRILERMLLKSKYTTPLNEESLVKCGKSLIYLEKNNIQNIIGYIESGKLPFEILYENENNLNLLAGKILARNNKVIPKINDSLLDYKNYRIEHINETSKLEIVGNEMRHCVGGCKKSLSNLSMLFFDVYNNKKVRYTLSVNFSIVKDKPKLSLDQYHGRFNSNPKNIDKKNIEKFVSELEKYIMNDNVFNYKKELMISVA